MRISEFDFDDLTPKEVSVKIKGKRYLLREASEDAARRYRNSIFRAARLSENGQLQAGDGLADAEPLLVSLCLYRLDDNGNLPVLGSGDANPTALVGLPFVLSQPSRVIKPLFRWIQENSSLTERDTTTPESLEQRIAEDTEALALLRNGEGEGSAKNLPSAMTAIMN